MRFVVASTDAECHRIMRAAIRADDPHEVLFGNMRSTSAGCDVGFLAFPFAADRYGGVDPTSRKAQVLVNDRGDGAPPIIVALPTLPFRDVAAGRAQVMSRAQWVAWALEGAVQALEESLGQLEDVTVHIQLEGVAMGTAPLDVLDVLRRVGAA